MSHLLEGQNLTKHFYDHDKEAIALEGVDYYLDEGEVLGVVGESGSGKSTLLKVVSGMLMPDEGDLFYKGERYKGKTPRQTGEFLQMIFQDAKSSFDPRMTMEKSILESGRKSKDREKMIELIKMVGLEEELLKRRPSKLSGGQCQRMSIARAFYSGASILLCDEITSALDVSSQAQVIEVMQKLKAEGRLSAVFVSHDIALVSMLCDRIMVMKDGKCVETGNTKDVIGNPQHEYTKILLESARKQSVDYGTDT